MMLKYRQENEIVKSSYLPVLTGFILNDERLEISVKKRGRAPGRRHGGLGENYR